MHQSIPHILLFLTIIAMHREITTRIGVARLMLQQTSGTSRHSAESKVQSEALVAEVCRCQLTPAQSSALLELSRDIPWACQNHCDAVKSAFEKAVRSPRRELQNFMAIHDYLLKEEWDALLSSSATQASRTDLLLNRVIRCGGRCLSEHTIKHLTSMLLVLSHPAERLALMPSCQKTDLNLFVKGEFKRKLRLDVPEPAHYFVTLPVSFESFRVTAQVGEAYFPGQVPVTCPADVLAVVAQIETSFRCRSVGSGAFPLVGSPLQLGNISAAGGQLERFAGFLVQGMSQMQASQARLIDALQHTNGRGVSPQPLEDLASSSQPLADLALQASPPRMQTALSLLRMPPLMPMQRGHVGIAALSAPANATPASAALAGAEQVANVEEQVPAVAAIADVDEDDDDNGPAGVTKLLSLLDERDADKKAAMATAKAAAAPKPAATVMRRPAAAPKATMAMRRPAAACAEMPNKKRPTVGLERSREQVMCRTGLGGPGSTTAFQYGEGKPYRSEKAALAAAKTWLAEELKRQAGLIISEIRYHKRCLTFESETWSSLQQLSNNT